MVLIDAKLAKNPLYDKTDPTTGDPLHAGMIRDGTTDKRGLAMNPDNLSMGINASNQLYGVPPDYPPCGPVQIQHQTNDAYDEDATLVYPDGSGMSNPISFAPNGDGVIKLHGFLWGIIFASQTYRVDATSPATGRFAFYVVGNSDVSFTRSNETDLQTAGGLLLAQGVISSDIYKTPGSHGEVWFPEPIDLSVMSAGAANPPYVDIFFGCNIYPYDMQMMVYYEGLPV